ncbi:MAG: hypothetical protein ABMA01_02630 [Chthoniobacteraceae bacterium]
MKTLLHLLPALCYLAAPVAPADDPPSDDAPTAVAQSPDAPALTYDTGERIERMPRCKGVVAEKFPCCALMTAPDGTNFWIGSPAGSSEVVSFVATLKEGRSYAFPDAFLAYRRVSK